MPAPIPVILFAYARPAHLAQVLAGLRENRVPLIYAFADAAKDSADDAAVAETRALLRAVDWCELHLTERPANLGLGRNVLSGVEEIAARHDAFIVWEDDLIAVPGTYAWVSAALNHYAEDARVMSVTAWTHPRVTPPGLNGVPYFDARAECWVWGTWARAWRGMKDEDATAKQRAAAARGIAPGAYGADLPGMAKDEHRRNIWAIRWLYHHLQHGGLSLRPPWSMVEHIGFDAQATNAAAAMDWRNPPLRSAPAILSIWPDAVEHPACRARWLAEARANPSDLGGLGRKLVRKVIPAAALDPLVQRLFRVRWEGNYPDWKAARAECGGYDSLEIFERVGAAARQVLAGKAGYDRDGVAFPGTPPWTPAVTVLEEMAAGGAANLTVLDFGGALGSTYRRMRPRLPSGLKLRWSVVEQPGLVESGRAEFASAELDFYPTIAEAGAAGVPDVILLASVLPYLEDPWKTVRELRGLGATRVAVEGTGFTAAGGNRLTVQRVPRSIYRASYPCWFFDRKDLVAAFAPDYRLVAEQDEATPAPAGLKFCSLEFAHAHR